jgi:hypothetical protein
MRNAHRAATAHLPCASITCVTIEAPEESSPHRACPPKFPTRRSGLCASGSSATRRAHHTTVAGLSFLDKYAPNRRLRGRRGPIPCCGALRKKVRVRGHPRSGVGAERLEHGRTPEGEPIRPTTGAELPRGMERLRPVREQIREFEATKRRSQDGSRRVTNRMALALQKITIALARQLQIAMWHFARDGVVPQGNVLRPAD